MGAPSTDHVWPAGTPVSQGGSGYKYVAASDPWMPDVWTRYEGTFGGIDYSGTNRQNMLPLGTATISVLMLTNRQEPNGNPTTTQIRNVTIEPAGDGSR